MIFGALHGLGADLGLGLTAACGSCRIVFHDLLNESVFLDDVRRLGEAVNEAVILYRAGDTTFDSERTGAPILFGDPALRLKLPYPERPTGLRLTRLGAGLVELAWDASRELDVVAYRIYYATTPTDPSGSLN